MIHVKKKNHLGNSTLEFRLHVAKIVHLKTLNEVRFNLGQRIQSETVSAGFCRRLNFSNIF